MCVRRAVAGILLFLFVLCGIALTAQTKGTFQAGINYSAGPVPSPSNTGYVGGGISPIESHVGDFNGDGKPDIVAAATCESDVNGAPGIPNCPSSGAAVVVYLSNGDGTFNPGIVSGGPQPEFRSIAVGDFNGDGKLDVAAVSDCLASNDCSSGTMTILLGNGDGTFSVGTTYPLGGVAVLPHTIAVADMNSDGKADIVVTLGCDYSNGGCANGAVLVYLGNGDGTFQSPKRYATSGNGGIPLVLGDFNKDGKPDVVVANARGASGGTSNSSVTFFPGNGDGTLGVPSVTILQYIAPQALVATDLNADGNLDLAVAAGENNISLSVLLGNGDGTFQTPVQYPLSANVSGDIAVADMNGDGKPDLVVGGTETSYFNAATVLINDGTGNFNNISTYFLGGLYASVAVADFNGDGKNDIVLLSSCDQDGLLLNGCPDGTLSVLLGNSDGTMRGATYLSEGVAPSRPSVAVADFNGDGHPDIIFPSGCIEGEFNCNTTGFTLLLSDGTGGYQKGVAFAGPGAQSQFVTVGDFNGDGKPDVAVFNACDDSCSQTSVSIFLNTGNGTFAEPLVYEGGGVTPVAITVGDFNGDGKLDIAILQQTQDWQVGILLGNGDGTFQAVVTTPIADGSPVSWFSAADFNGDGKSDLVLAESSNSSNSYAGSAHVLLSNGDGTFTFGETYDSGGDVSCYGCGNPTISVTTGDVNGDGKADIVLANLCDAGNVDAGCAQGAIGVLLGNGDGTFQPATSQTIQDGNLWAISLADVNGDGRLDAIASTSTGIAVAFGKGDGSFQPPTIYAALQVSQNVQLAIADLNGDGGLDIVQPSVNGQLAILYNQGFAKVGPVVSLQSSTNPSVSGKAVTFTAKVSGTAGAATGKVVFKNGSLTLATVNLKNGIAKYTSTKLRPGFNAVTAIYNGITSAPLNQFVLAATATSLTSSPNPSVYGQTVTFTATVTSSIGAPPDGEAITFKQGTTVLGSATLSGGSASITTATLGVGTKSVKALYGGDANLAASASPAISQVVNKASTKTALTSSLNPSSHGQSVTFTAAVTPQFGGTPTGSVTFIDGTTTLKTVVLSGDVAAFSTSKLGAGSHNITANYKGNASFTPSSGTLSQSVN